MEHSKSKALDKKVNAGTGRRLTKKESAHKMRNWPRGNPSKEEIIRLNSRDN